MVTIKKKISLLLIDDSPEDRFIYINYLKKNNEFSFIVEESASGEEGLEICRSHKPDCLLLDYNLPDMDGLEVLSGLSPIRFPVIMLTGQGSQQVAVKALKSGAHDYLIKNEITPSLLTQTILSAIKIFKIEKEKQAFSEELKRSNQALGEFAQVASHDLQEPLRKIDFYAEKIWELNHDNMSDQCKNYLSRLQKSTKRMSQFIDDLLSYSKITTQDNPFKAINLNEVIKLAVSDLETRITKSKAQINVDELPVINGDPTQMYQLFLNLISNGLKFNRSHPPVIDITCKKVGINNWEIQVTDNGIGINNEFKERVFEPFFRLQNRSEFVGSGTGLAICKKLVERHQGVISANSKLGEGTTITIILPEKHSLVDRTENI